MMDEEGRNGIKHRVVPAGDVNLVELRRREAHQVAVGSDPVEPVGAGLRHGGRVVGEGGEGGVAGVG